MKTLKLAPRLLLRPIVTPNLAAGLALLLRIGLMSSLPVAQAAVTLINFDDVASGTLINNHYSGVIFTNPIGGNILARSGLGDAPSAPNVVCETNGGILPFFDSMSGAVDASFATPMRSVRIDVRPVSQIADHLDPTVARPYLQAFDGAGNLLGTVYYAGALPQGCCWEVGTTETLTITSGAANIARARFSCQQPISFVHTYGMFDNLRFDDGFYSLNVNIVGNGVVLTSPPGPYFYGSSAGLTASPSPGWSFIGWSGAFNSALNSALITMDADKNVTATFIPTPQTGPNYIVTTTDDHDDGDPGVVDCTLREAINAANASADASTITFAPNVTGVIALTLGELTVSQNLALLGPGAKVLAISGDTTSTNRSRVFNVSGGTVFISSLTISNGLVIGAAGSPGQMSGGAGGSGGEAWGGGIHNQAVLTVSNCWIVGNRTQGGAGGRGGPDDAIHPAGPGGIGGLGAGGGIYNHGELTLLNCTVSGNSAVGGHGGNGSDAGNLSLTAGGGGLGGDGQGGGVGNSVFLHMTNCTLSGNSCGGGTGGRGGNGFTPGAGGAGGRGLGGGFFTIPEAYISSCTVSLNSLNAGAGGLGPPNGSPGREEGGGLVMVFGPIYIQNSLIAGNNALFAPDCSGNFISAGHNLIGILSGASGFTSTGDQTGTSGSPHHPLLGPLLCLGGPTPTMALLPGSPALDKGHRFVLTTDQRGRPRPHDIPSITNAPGGDGSDIGAFELQQPALTITRSLGGTVVFSWPADDAGFTLQCTPQLTPTTIWTTVPTAPALAGGQYTVTLRSVAGKQFYRLIWAGVVTIPDLFNTGVGANGALLASGVADLHWHLIQSADPAFPGPDAIVVNDTGFPIPPWLANGPASKWIAPQASQAAGNAVGSYTYRITFDLTGLEPSTAVIVGHWTSDDSGPQVLLNGNTTGVNSDGNFTALGNAFTIGTGFIAGLNTLDFVVNNGGLTVNPTGVRVELSGTANLRP